MKVMCIKSGRWSGNGSGPKYGSINTVTGNKVSPFNRLRYYVLEEWPDGYYLCDHFIPLSDIDETELAEKRKEPEYA